MKCTPVALDLVSGTRQHCQEVAAHLFQRNLTWMKNELGANNVSFHMVKETINYSKVSTRFVTVNPQKDGRVVLGTSVHKFQDCQTLKRRSIVDISGSPDLIKHFQKCTWCYNRKD